MSQQELVLITGITGYLGSHVLNEFLKAGFKVRGTVRSLKDENKIKPLKELVQSGKDKLELVEADLLNVDSLTAAINGCTYVIHVASPYPSAQPKDESEILKPAIDGTIGVLEACLAADVKRVVVTSSELAATGAPFKNGKMYNEKDWGDPNTPWTYCKSKILAEKAAWDFVAEKKKNKEKCFELVVINPSLILGPVLNSGAGTSSEMFLNIFLGKIKKIKEGYYPTCDVRDVALAHVRAITVPQAAGNRFLIVSKQDFIPVAQWAEILHKEFSSKGYKIPTEIEKGDASGKTSRTDDRKMKNILKITQTDFRDTIVDMANSLIAKGIA